MLPSHTKLAWRTRKLPFRQSWGKKNFDKPRLLPIISVYQNLVGPIRNNNKKQQVRCFYHDDNKASMTLYTDTSTFYCFTCRKWGSSYDIIMQIKGITFKEALMYGKNYL